MSVTEEVDDIRTLIKAGAFDDELGRIESAIVGRRARMAKAFGDELDVGDRVRLKGFGMGAKYMNGAPATVTGFAIKNVKVRIDDSWDCRRYSHNLRIPPSNLERIQVLPPIEEQLANLKVLPEVSGEGFDITGNKDVQNLRDIIDGI